MGDRQTHTVAYVDTGGQRQKCNTHTRHRQTHSRVVAREMWSAALLGVEFPGRDREKMLFRP